ncbi:unnamed protein product [Pleuronectes platessa]|uniref:Uncharacterized protein n=1 Tax=Pleuronectes platessa TaxID=8262 RepID=A0A9N7VA08_PLEPL|nr:unnamed protein product [Pleuronectes platessa]
MFWGILRSGLGISAASEMGIRHIDSGECQRALEQRAAICQPSELATPPAAVAKRPTKQDMHAASDVCGHTALQRAEKARSGNNEDPARRRRIGPRPGKFSRGGCS